MRELKEKYKAEFIDCAESAKRLQQKSRKQLVAKPKRKKWSALECIEHLNNTARIYLPQIEKGLMKYSKHSDSDANGSYKHRLIAAYIINYFEPPYRIKLKTFFPFEPKNNNEDRIDKIFNDFREYQLDFIELIERAFELELKRVIVTSPLSSLINFRLGEIFPFLAAHQRRHLWQAEKSIEIVSR